MSKALIPADPIISTIKLVVFDFDGVFTDNTVWVNERGEESVRCWRSDGLGIAKLRAANIPMVVISTEANPVVSARCEKLQLPCKQGLAHKVEALVEVMAEYGVMANQVAYVGNDINDLECLQMVECSIVVADAHPDAVAVANYQTTKPGGFGAVREVCDWLVGERARV